MPLNPKIFIFSPPLALFLGGSYYTYDSYWPKTIGEWYKKEGIQEIKDEKPEHYRAMFNDNFSLVSKLKISDITSQNAHEKLKE